MPNSTNVHLAHAREMSQAMYPMYRDLIAAAEEAYAAQQMASIIHPGWMRTEAEEEAKRCQLELYNIITTFDDARMEHRNYCIKHDLRETEWDCGLELVKKHLRSKIFKK